MGSHLHLKLANAFLVHSENNWYKIAHLTLSLITTVGMLMISLFYLPKHLGAFQNFLNGQHANMPFAIESEKPNRMSFLDKQIIREDKTFTISGYRKPTFSGVYAHFDSFLPSAYKFGTIYKLANRCLRICSS